MKPYEDNVRREGTSQQVASVVQPEPAMLHEDEWDLEIPVVDAMLPANCHSAQPSCVLGPRAQVPGTEEADGVPSTNEPVPVPTELGVETPLFVPVDGKLLKQPVEQCSERKQMLMY
ncbi:uncharacterized protein LOC125941104 [Dermacentor silvarum]|uniref:uncharacterized protein LOC125941104 n=1 Tax=Dermacentor silvarum TaxID=543639 RepID=UPI0021013F0A|nr:uncharacterized protein LOC125941104 [Dermacentor silvarum]